MKKEDHFKTKDVTHTLDGSYVLRITKSNKPSYAAIIVGEKIDKDFGRKFLNNSKVSRLSWGAVNPQKKDMTILTFNIPEEGVAYKMIYDGSWKKENGGDPQKVFCSTEEGKWHVVEHPSKELIERFRKEREAISKHVDPRPDSREQEGPVVFLR